MSCCAELLCSLGVGRAEPRGLSPRLIKLLYPLPRRSPDHALEPNDQSSPALKRRVSSQHRLALITPVCHTPSWGAGALSASAFRNCVRTQLLALMQGLRCMLTKVDSHAHARAKR